MRQIQQIGRRAWLARMAKGTFVVWAEVTFGLGRKGLSIAIGDDRLAGSVAQAQTRDPVHVARVITDFVSSYVLVRGKEAAIVDTGLPNNGEKFGEVIKTAGLGWDAVGHVILTHYHRDHVGSMGEVLKAAPKALVYAGEADIAKIQSPRSIKAVGDGDDVFGLQIIATPGHTPGHICVYDPVGSLMVLGDAMVNMGGQLTGANPQYTADMDQANESVKKLAALTFNKAFFGHGEPIEQRASSAVARVATAL
ncbi:MAG TPA: MBL fold metallo-hydrolase [Candidatus Entotheonella sp.]|jgi:glyoxylase-like metal-dependent hydrolase (beta-lactamase superfamily II)